MLSWELEDVLEDPEKYEDELKDFSVTAVEVGRINTVFEDVPIRIKPGSYIVKLDVEYLFGQVHFREHGVDMPFYSHALDNGLTELVRIRSKVGEDVLGYLEFVSTKRLHEKLEGKLFLSGRYNDSIFPLYVHMQHLD